MKKIMLFIWQLPQNILGLLVALFTAAKKNISHYEENISYYATNVASFGVSLGNFIVFGVKKNNPSSISISHEHGHQIQSLYLGPLYLILIGLPSFLGNIYDRIAHKKWDVNKRIKWYYNQPWEKWADNLGNVNRF